VWLMRMCIPFAVTTVLLFWVPPMFPTMLKYVYVFLMYNIVNAVCYTAMLVPYFSMISLISQNSYERGFLGNVQQIFSTLGNVVINSVFIVLLTRFTSDAANIYTQQAFTLTMSVICIAMVVLAMVCVIFTKERAGVIRTEEEKAAEEKSRENDATTLETVKALLTNKYWVMLTIAMFVVFFVIIMYAVGAVYYAQYIFDDMGQYSWMANSISIAQFVTMFVTPVIMTKIDKRWIYTAGIGVLSLGFLGFGLFGSSIPIMIGCNVLKGVGLGMSGGMALGMVADTITYGNLKSGINTVGMGNAGVSAAQKLGMGLGTAVLGWVLSAAGFDGALPAAEQPAAVGTAIQFLYTWLPLIMCVVVLVIMTFFYNIKKDLARMQSGN
ncbi:MAG: MFS transporter, partial [Lachnospiraceae bacterium]|nr:MFS transporter [Lachnospiraceae bacterium]